LPSWANASPVPKIFRRASPKRKGLRGERPEGKPSASYGVKIFGLALLNARVFWRAAAKNF